MPDPQPTTPSTSAKHVPADWRTAFARLAEAAPRSHTPVALGFEVVEVVARTWFEPKHSKILTKDEVTPGANPSLAIRPLVLSESGNWVKKSLTWRTIDRMARQFDTDPRHLYIPFVRSTAVIVLRDIGPDSVIGLRDHVDIGIGLNHLCVLAEGPSEEILGLAGVGDEDPLSRELGESRHGVMSDDGRSISVEQRARVVGEEFRVNLIVLIHAVDGSARH